VVLDLLMPEMDGFEFLDRFRRTEAGARTPVIVWTVKDLTAEERVRLRTSAQRVVQKGAGEVSALVEELNAYVPAHPRAEGTAAKSPGTRRKTSKGQNLRVSPGAPLGA
jgi:CheY-like chemotaxis protein